jgi:hypothetical protein
MEKVDLLVILFLLIPFCTASLYGVGTYGSGNYSGVEEEITSIGRRGDHPECLNNLDCKENHYCFNYICYEAECINDTFCNVKEGEVCLNYRCVKLFDMEILEFESPVKIGEFFNFTYFLKVVAEIEGDVEINFWIEKKGEKITSGKDTIYMGSFDEKIKTKRLFLPKNIFSGVYIFYIEVMYEKYKASAYRTIEIDVKEDRATIIIKEELKQNLIYFLIGFIIFMIIVILIFYFKKKKKKRKK